jgi:tellurite methyltransferase
MSPSGRVEWDQRHQGQWPGEPEPFVVEMLPRLPRGLALDVAAGRGRHSLLLARAGMRVIAVDYSIAGIRTLANAARLEGIPVMPVVADMTQFPLGQEKFDVILNVNFLERGLIADLKRALRIGAALLFDTFLIDEATNGHIRNPRHLLRHSELRTLLDGLDIIEYREGLTIYGDPTRAEPPSPRAWRASALAFRRR